MKKFLILFSMFIAFNANANEALDKHSLVVSTTAEIEAPVDNVTINLQINTRDKDLQIAKNENVKRYDKVLKNITGELDLPKDSIESNFVSVNPAYVQCYQPQPVPVKVVKCDAGKIDYYMVNRTIQLKLNKLDKYDALIEGLTHDGATEINTGQYGVTEIEKIKDNARDLAIDNAHQKAVRIADKLGVKLLKPIHFDSSDSSPVVYRPMTMMKSAMVADSAPPPTDPETLGKIKVMANVNITYEIE